MASVAELERLSALTQRLIPISQFQRGALIRADDWNLLAAAVIELARAVILDTESAAVNDHVHADEVDIGWLTPRLRTLMEQGGLADPVADRRLLTVERNNQKNSKRIDSLLLDIAKFRTSIDGVKVNDIGRESDLTILRRQFEAQSDSRDEVLDLRNTLDSIRLNIDRALELGELISVDGEIADISGLSDRIKGLETLRDSLVGTDGNVLDAKTLEIRLAELQTKFVSQEQLDEALDQVRVRPPQDLVDTLKADLNGLLDTELTQRLDAQQTLYDARYINNGQLTDQLNARDRTLSEQSAASILALSTQSSTKFVANDTLETRLQTLTASLANSLQADIDTALKSSLDSLQANLDTRFVSAVQLNSRLAGLSTELQQSIGANLRSEITTGVQAALEQQGRQLFVSQDSFASEIAAINKRVDSDRELNAADINAAVSALSQQFVSNDVFESRLNAQQAQFDATVQERIIEQVDGQINSKISASLEEVNGRLDGLELVENRINTSTTNQLDSMRQDFSKISQQAIATEIQGLQINLRSVQDQVSSINTRMTAITNEAVAGAMLAFKNELQADLNLVQQNISRIDKQLVELKPAQPAISDNLLRPAQPVITENNPVILRSEAIQPATPSDFTELNGIGAVYASRLAENNVQNFSELASMSSTQLASILKTSEARVDSLQLQQNAAARLKV